MAEATDCPLSVVQTDNGPRVRDGYINLGTHGHARHGEKGGDVQEKRDRECSVVPASTAWEPPW
jgi:hypothetical protein